jgi:hypothetical protein
MIANTLKPAEVTEPPKNFFGATSLDLAQLMPPRETQDKLVDDILEIFDDVLNNRDSGNGDLDFAERIASRIDDMMKTAGITSFAQAAIMMVAEAKSKTNKDLFSEVSERLADEGERKKNQDNILGDFVMDARRDRQQQAQQKIDQDNYNRTYSNDQLDTMEWQGDADDIWNISGVNISRKDAFGAGKKARDNWNNSPDAKAMSPEDKAKVDLQFSQYLQAIKNGDHKKALEIKGQMPPSAQAHVEQFNREAIGTGASHEVQQTASIAVDTQTSVAVGSSVFASAPKNACAANDLSMGSACETLIATHNRPTSAFNQSANPRIETTPTATVSNSNLTMAQVPETSKVKVAALETF